MRLPRPYFLLFPEVYWQRGVREKYKRPGRNSKLTMVALVYYRCYVTYNFIAALIGTDASTIGRIVRRIEKLLADAICLRKVQELTMKNVKQIIVDATESPIQRPTRDQRTY